MLASLVFFQQDLLLLALEIEASVAGAEENSLGKGVISRTVSEGCCSE